MSTLPCFQSHPSNGSSLRSVSVASSNSHFQVVHNFWRISQFCEMGRTSGRSLEGRHRIPLCSVFLEAQHHKIVVTLSNKAIEESPETLLDGLAILRKDILSHHRGNTTVTGNNEPTRKLSASHIIGASNAIAFETAMLIKAPPLDTCRSASKRQEVNVRPLGATSDETRGP